MLNRGVNGTVGYDVISFTISFWSLLVNIFLLLTGCWGTQVLPPLSRASVARQDFLLHQEVESTKQHQESPRSTGLAHSTSVQLQFPFKRCPWNWSPKNGWFSSFWAPAVMFTKNTLWGQRAKTLPQKEQVMKWWLGGVFFWTLGRFGINSDGTLIYSNSLGMFGLGGFETLSLSKDAWIPRPMQAFHWKLICLLYLWKQCEGTRGTHQLCVWRKLFEHVWTSCSWLKLWVCYVRFLSVRGYVSMDCFLCDILITMDKGTMRIWQNKCPLSTKQISTHLSPQYCDHTPSYHVLHP